MLVKTHKNFKKNTICLAVGSALAISGLANAEEKSEEESTGFETITITATRRADTVQEAPINISAMDAESMKAHNISSPEDVARWVPGLTIPEQGGREQASIIVRGLNTNSSGRLADSGTVATYFGEIPLTSDFRITDLERVEVLIGPQGTLYGAGTLGGAIRYIFNKPDLSETFGQISGDLFSLNQSSGVGNELGATFNFPIIEDKLAVRVNLNHFDTPGYIDYNYTIKEPGVSNPDPDWNNQSEVDSNIKRIEDANDETTTTARIAVRWNPTDNFNATFSHFYQKQENGGNSIVHYNALSDTNPLSSQVGRYEAAPRFAEPNKKEVNLSSLELEFDLGFAELVSATGLSTNEAIGQRDQTDLLMDIWTGYADFPGFTRDTQDDTTTTQEIRLVSQSESNFNWIVGVYYSKAEITADNREFTPSITDAFFGGVYDNLENDMEFINLVNNENKEKAVFGELTYDFSDKLTTTFGFRFFDYDLKGSATNHAPFFDGPLTSINDLSFTNTEASDNGSLFKFNLGYDFTDDFMSYFTISEGFRLGGANALPACTNPPQQVCALPNELAFSPDKSTNTEIGFKSSWADNSVIFNGAIFNVDWDDAQVASVSTNGAQGIVSNAGKANSKGVEFSVRAMLSEEFSMNANYSFAKAELTEDAPFLFGTRDVAGSEIQNHYDGKAGDRLPGSPEHQLSLGLRYDLDVLNDKLLTFDYGLTYQSDVYTKVGLKADGEVLPGYSLSDISAKLAGEAWSVTLYVENMFDKYAFTGMRRDKAWAGQATFASQNRALPELQRTYGHHITKPRTVGVRFVYDFDVY